MNKIYYLSTCSTCQRIMKDLPLNNFQLQDIKQEPLTKEDLLIMHKMAGSYEMLFSRRAMKYRSLGLNTKNLSEQDYRDWILKEYTFLKRPVIISESSIFIGSSKSTIHQIQQKL